MATATKATATKATATAAPAMLQGSAAAPAAAPVSNAAAVPALMAYVVVHLAVRTTGAGASVARKAAGYTVGTTLQQCRAAGITAADIQWDMPRANVVIAAPGTPAALAALAIAAGNGTPAHSATIAAALPALIAAQKAAFVPRGSKLPAPVV